MTGQRWDDSLDDAEVFESALSILNEGCGYPDDEDASFPLDLPEADDGLPEHAYPDRRPR